MEEKARATLVGNELKNLSYGLAHLHGIVITR